MELSVRCARWSRFELFACSSGMGVGVLVYGCVRRGVVVLRCAPGTTTLQPLVAGCDSTICFANALFM